MIFKLMYRQDLTKTFNLTYEASEMMQAVFDKNRATNTWRAPARMLKEFSDHFGLKTESLEISSEADQVKFTSYTEKICHGKGT